MIFGTKKRGMNMADLVMYLAVALKHLRLIILLTCVCVLGGLTYYVYARPAYFSNSTVRFKYFALPVDSDKIFHDSGFRDFVPQFNSRPVILRTAKRLGLEENERILYRDFVSKIRVAFNSDKNLEIQVWSYYPKLTRVWAETMVEEFLLNREQQRRQYRETAVKTFTEEMTSVSQKIKEVLKSQQLFDENSEKIKSFIDLEQLKELPRQTVIVRNRIEAMERIRKALQESKLDTVEQLSLLMNLDKDIQSKVGQVIAGSEDPDGRKSPSIVVVPSMVSTGDKSPWDDLERRRSQVQQKIKDAGRVYLPGNPRMQVLLKELDDIEKQLGSELEVAKNRFNIEYANLTSKLAELDRKLPEYQASLARERSLKSEKEISEAGQLAWNKIYADMAKILQTIDFAGEKERIQLEYVGITDDNDQRPVSPNKIRILLYALGLGLALGLGVPFLIEFLDHTVTNVEQAEHTFQIRGLGIVPQFADREIEAPLHLGSRDKKVAHLIENFRVIRTNLVSRGMATQIPHVIMIASSMPQEGKTVVSTNLAMSFAQSGERTLLIDADLRRGRLHRCFGLKSSPGLSNVLMEGIPVEEAIRPSTHENLGILSCGKHLTGATELLGSPHFAKLMSDLRQKYQRIIIDTPPVLGLSETSLIQKLTDGVLFVVWSGHTPLRSVKTAIDILHANGANFYGFVLNRMDFNSATNYYNYYYYSSNYYDSYQTAEKA
ncbi:MAG: polysaccharide biosynthesis tyrosine autokinase [Verrucomicrobia bacterium]|nr:polysaccharide biosynthesis tyrosine autokinase [Verrucomicrobiota bacterium]